MKTWPFGTTLEVILKDLSVSIKDIEIKPVYSPRMAGIFEISNKSGILASITVDYQSPQHQWYDMALGQMLFNASNTTTEHETLEYFKELAKDKISKETYTSMSITGWKINPASNDLPGNITGVLHFGGCELTLDIHIPAIKEGQVNPRIKYYNDFILDQLEWIKSLQITSAEPGCEKAIGAIRESDFNNRVMPYFSAMAVFGVLDAKEPAYIPVAKNFIHWYFNNLNDGITDSEVDIDGTVYDYAIEVAKNRRQHAIKYSYTLHNGIPDYDSSDAYAAFQLTSIYKTYMLELENGKCTADYLVSKFDDINRVFEAMLVTKTNNNLTGAKVTYMAEYTMDNAEVIEALANCVNLYEILENNLSGDEKFKANMYKKRAESEHKLFLEAMEKHLWKGDSYLPSTWETEIDWNVWYADATCQAVAIATEATKYYPERTEKLWEKFNDYYSSENSQYDWEYMDHPNPRYIWAYVALAAARAKDYRRVDAFADEYTKHFRLQNGPVINNPLTPTPTVNYNSQDRTKTMIRYQAEAGSMIRAAVIMRDYYKSNI